MATFDKRNFAGLCDALAVKDKDLGRIIQQHGYPPVWKRKPCFETLVHIILEQQVSLASAKAALDKLKLKIGDVTPANLLLLDDGEMKSCYFSKQKMVYARHLAESVISKTFSFSRLKKMDDDAAKDHLKRIKGIGDWTADVFLMMALGRTDCFPVGDIALIKSIKHVKGLPGDCTTDEILAIAENWKPYRTIAAYLLWHSYLERRRAG